MAASIKNLFSFFQLCGKLKVGLIQQHTDRIASYILVTFMILLSAPETHRMGESQCEGT